jgi:nicotinate-nucleotide adenylyltransferase
MDRKKRIALYGGTFDPIHLGHLEVARKVSRLFEIDELWFVLAQLAPHKQTRAVTTALHRYAMLALATQDEERFRISTFELDVPGRCYTVDTLTHFNAEWGGSADLYFVMGADSWSEIKSWRDSDRLLALTNHIVVSRPGYELGINHVGPEVADRIVDLRRMETQSASVVIQEARGEKIFITDAVMTDVSATDIRRAAGQAGGKLTDMVPGPVADYIAKYELYREWNEREFNH